jgi:glycosyltransferase involved in cell wall biosynthesis
MSDGQPTPVLRLAYLVSRYPAISHAFILREVRRLRSFGFVVHVASINDPDRPCCDLTGEEAEEAGGTFYVKRAGIRGVLAPHLATLARRPSAYLRGMMHALRLGGADLAAIVYGFFYFAEAVVVGRWMERHRLHHLHVHFATPAAMVGLIATRVFPITLSITVHGPDEFYDVTAYRLREKIAGASFVCCIGAFARSQLMKLAPVLSWDRFELAPLGVDPAAFAPRRERPERGPFEVLCVGRLVPAKGQHILIEAVARLVADGRDVKLRLVGDGPDRRSLERMVEARGLAGRVVLEGPVNQDRIREHYAAADAFALASFAEGIPVVLMEAMAMQVPCVATFVAGIPELIRDGVDGLLVAPSDVGALAGAIARLMDDAALRRRVAEQGRRHVLEAYDLERNTRRLADIFRRRIVGGAPA